MKTHRILLLVTFGVLAGCTSNALVRGTLIPECNDRDHKAISRAAVCVGAAAYEISQEKKAESR